MKWSLGKGHYHDEKGHLKQILLQHIKKEDLFHLELEDKCSIDMNFKKCIVQI
jgi:nitrogen fixation-related uncharacterized protein